MGIENDAEKASLIVEMLFSLQEAQQSDDKLECYRLHVFNSILSSQHSSLKTLKIIVREWSMELFVMIDDGAQSSIPNVVVGA